MRKPLITAICLLALSACADSPTSTHSVPHDARRSESASGGWTAGSGNKGAPSDTTTTATTSTTSTSTADTDPCESDEFGGWTAGSGNVTCVTP
jgi:hypothetical protein